MVYDEKKIVARSVRFEYDLTPVPDLLRVEWQHEYYYVIDGLTDESSLVWIDVVAATFNELLPGYNWGVDDPGTLYVYNENTEDPVDKSKLNEVAAVALERYRSIYETSGLPCR